jgi:hypothetical protein
MRIHRIPHTVLHSASYVTSPPQRGLKGTVSRHFPSPGYFLSNNFHGSQWARLEMVSIFLIILQVIRIRHRLPGDEYTEESIRIP